MNKSSDMNQKQLNKKMKQLMDRVVEANQAYCDELDKPKRNRTARQLLRHARDNAFNDLIEFAKEHGL